MCFFIQVYSAYFKSESEISVFLNAFVNANERGLLGFSQHATRQTSMMLFRDSTKEGAAASDLNIKTRLCPGNDSDI